MSHDPQHAFASTLEQMVQGVVERLLEERLLQVNLATSVPAAREATAVPTLMDYEELAEFLKLGQKGPDGKRKGGVRTIRGWVAEGRIPFLKAGDRVLFNVDEIYRWLSESAEKARARHDGRVA
jgi:excisionase family DNA binding protein